MIWENSSFLWLLLLIPLIGAAYWWWKNRQISRRREQFDDRLVDQLRQNYWKTGDKVRLISFMLAALFFIIALAGPKIGTEVREVQRTGLNLMVALDLSRSMNVQDVPPSRLDKAKFEINRLVNRLSGDRIGLLVFTDEAFNQAPLTTDYSAMRLFLDIANTDQMPYGGTNFTAALSRASEAFDSMERHQGAANVLVLVADGEHHGPSYEEELNLLTEKGIIVFTVGIGTREGGLIPVTDESGRIVSYHRDESGNTVTSTLDPQTLQDIARTGGGEYYELNSGSDTIEPFFARLDELERGEFSSQEYADYENRYQILLLTGLGFFMVALFFPESIKKRESWKRRFGKDKTDAAA
ncbi:MAG: VWA domain-containing protein [Balneolaceae bacterium]|nr:VWA domain-containing protein [Balneolaceae bacterium]